VKDLGHLDRVPVRVPFDERGHHREAAGPPSQGFDQCDAGGGFARRVHEAEAFGVEALGRQRSKQVPELMRRVDERTSSVSPGDLASRTNEPSEFARPGKRLSGGHAASPWRHVRRIADDEIPEATVGLGGVPDVYAHDIAPVSPPVRVDVARDQTSGDTVKLDEDDALRRFEPKQRQTDCPDSGPQVERNPYAAGSGRQVLQEEGVDVGSVACTPARLV